MPKPRILAFAGSLRKDSFNKKLVKIAVEGARSTGARVTVVDLKDFPLPLYDADLEANSFPGMASKLKALFFENQGFLIASPEYNGAFSGALKNAIDWVSRPESKDEPSLVCFRGKTAAIMSASPGGLGGLRGLQALRMLLGNLGVLVLPNQIAVSKAHEVFDASGSLKDEKQLAAVMELGVELSKTTEKLIS